MKLQSFFSINRPLHHEGFIIILTLTVFLLFPFICRSIDVTSAPVDPGVLSIVIIALLAFLVFKSVTWTTIKIIWPVFADYSELHFEEDFRTLCPVHKVIIYLTFYLFLLFGMVATLAALAS